MDRGIRRRLRRHNRRCPRRCLPGCWRRRSRHATQLRHLSRHRRAPRAHRSLRVIQRLFHHHRRAPLRGLRNRRRMSHRLHSATQVRRVPIRPRMRRHGMPTGPCSTDPCPAAAMDSHTRHRLARRTHKPARRTGSPMVRRRLPCHYPVRRYKASRFPLPPARQTIRGIKHRPPRRLIVRFTDKMPTARMCQWQGLLAGGLQIWLVRLGHMATACFRPPVPSGDHRGA